MGTNKLIFADLDGIFFVLVNHFGKCGVSARTLEEIQIVEGLGEVLSDLVAAKFTIVGVTNQPEISRGLITQKFLDEKHGRLRQKYPQVTEIFVCTHTDIDLCRCRKPKLGLFNEAGTKYDADFSLSWTIGDRRSDIEAGHYKGTKTILVQTQWNSESTVPVLGYVTAVVKDVQAALSLILARESGTKKISDVYI